MLILNNNTNALMLPIAKSNCFVSNITLRSSCVKKIPKGRSLLNRKILWQIILVFAAPYQFYVAQYKIRQT